MIDYRCKEIYRGIHTMEIFDFKFDNWYTLNLQFNWILVVGAIIIGFVVSWLWKRFINFSINKSVVVDGVTLGIGNSSMTLKYNRKDQEIAYKLWVELSTRKIGLEFDPEYDVISEVYDSWYAFFGIARDLMKDIPCEKLDSSSDLIELTGNVLNVGLRPHLTKWQAKFRKWYEVNKDHEEYKDKTPQEIQTLYPLYSELEENLIQTNNHMIEYKNLMQKIAFNK